MKGDFTAFQWAKVIPTFEITNCDVKGKGDRAYGLEVTDCDLQGKRE
jgi:hypothetical protein